MSAVITISFSNSVEELEEDLVVNFRRSQGCDFDDLLKVYFYYILEKRSEEKKKLDNLQERIEKREQQVHAAVRGVRAPNLNNQAQGEWTNSKQRMLLTTAMPL